MAKLVVRLLSVVVFGWTCGNGQVPKQLKNDKSLTKHKKIIKTSLGPNYDGKKQRKKKKKMEKNHLFFYQST